MEKVDFSDLISKLPPIISREKVGEYTGGVISPKTLANYASEGKGPKQIKCGRKICYMTEDLFRWMENRSKYLL